MPESTSAYDHVRTGAGLFDFSSHGLLEVAGREAAMFLHNVTSNDVKGLAVDASCEVFLLTHTAHVVGYGLLFRHPPEGRKDVFTLSLSPGQDATVVRHLDRHLISEDAVVTDRSATRARYYVAGPRAAEIVGRALGVEVALEPLRQVVLGGVLLRRHDELDLPGYELLCLREEEEAWGARLREAGAVPTGEEVFEVLRVEAGFPLFGRDVDESTFAPTVGRTKQAVSYSKGCYLGQEPIVMARDRGVVPRTLVGLRFPEGPVAPGSALVKDGKEVGRVTSSVVSPRLGAIGLGYVKRGSQAPGTELLGGGESSVRVVVAELPMKG